MVKASIPAGGSLSMHYCHIHAIWMGSNHTRNGGRFISTRTIPTQTGPTTGGSAVRFQSALIFVATNMLAPSQHTPLLECIIHMAWVCGCQPTAPTAFPVLPGSVLLARPACCALANASSSPGTPLTTPSTCRGSGTSWWRNVVRGKGDSKEVQWQSPYSDTCGIYSIR